MIKQESCNSSRYHLTLSYLPKGIDDHVMYTYTSLLNMHSLVFITRLYALSCHALQECHTDPTQPRLPRHPLWRYACKHHVKSQSGASMLTQAAGKLAKDFFPHAPPLLLVYSHLAVTPTELQDGTPRGRTLHNVQCSSTLLLPDLPHAATAVQG